MEQKSMKQYLEEFAQRRVEQISSELMQAEEIARLRESTDSLLESMLHTLSQGNGQQLLRWEEQYNRLLSCYINRFYMAGMSDGMRLHAFAENCKWEN